MHFFRNLLKINIGNFCDFWAFEGMEGKKGQKKVCKREEIIRTCIINRNARACVRKRGLTIWQ